MAMKMACDVFDTVKDIRPVKVAVAVGDDEDDTPTKEITVFDGNLSPRAVERLLKKIHDGMRPPTPNKKPDEDEGSNQDGGRRS